MIKMNNKNAEAHFEFGKNWESYTNLVDERRISNAVAGLKKLIPTKEIKGKSFFDIGCGSGLSMLSAIRLGARNVRGIDIDAHSVNATHTLLSRYAPAVEWRAEQESVFNLDPKKIGQFDIVHSWGVLHHTGAMWEALEKAQSLVKPNGLLVIALYRKTAFCGLWRIEKKIYTHAPKWVQFLIRLLYKTMYFIAVLAVTRVNPLKTISSHKERGMDWEHDVHDWLGGYPYESATRKEVVERMESLGFTCKREFLASPKNRLSDILGSACDQYVFQKRP